MKSGLSHRPQQRYWLHALLFVLTVFTTLVMGARMQYNFEHGQSVFSFNDVSLPWFPLVWILAQPNPLAIRHSVFCHPHDHIAGT